MAKKKEDKEKEETTADKVEGKNMIDEAKETVAALAKENEEKKKLLDREEKLMAEKALSGEADQHKPEKKPEETDEEYAARFEKGEVDPLEEDLSK